MRALCTLQLAWHTSNSTRHHVWHYTACSAPGRVSGVGEDLSVRMGAQSQPSKPLSLLAPARSQQRLQTVRVAAVMVAVLNTH